MIHSGTFCGTVFVFEERDVPIGPRLRRLTLCHLYAVDGSSRDAHSVETAATPAPAKPARAATPRRPAALNYGQRDAARDELGPAYADAKAAWYLARQRRRDLDALAKRAYGFRSVEAAKADEVIAEQRALHEEYLDKLERWFGAQEFRSSIELDAYLCGDVEDWSQPWDDEERWIRVWIHLCSLRRVGRDTALEMAGRSVAAYVEKIRKRVGKDGRNGERGRNDNYFLSEIEAEQRALATALENVSYLRRDAVSVPSLAEIEVRFAQISGLDGLVAELHRWRGNLAKSPRCTELVTLRERRLVAVAALMVDSEPWKLAARG